VNAYTSNIAKENNKKLCYWIQEKEGTKWFNCDLGKILQIKGDILS
jgi:hypothetical protein